MDFIFVSLLKRPNTIKGIWPVQISVELFDFRYSLKNIFTILNILKNLKPEYLKILNLSFSSNWAWLPLLFFGAITVTSMSFLYKYFERLYAWLPIPPGSGRNSDVIIKKILFCKLFVEFLKKFLFF